MKKSVLYFAIPVCLSVLVACSGSADKKVPQLANEMCDCFTNFQKGLSPEVVDLLKKVSLSSTPQEEITAGISKLSPEDGASFAEKFKSIGDKGSEVNICLENFDKHHSKETTKDKKALTQKMLKIMQENSSCPVGAAVVNLGLSKGVVN
jgi:hypothetical protein